MGMKLCWNILECADSCVVWSEEIEIDCNCSILEMHV